MEMSSPAAHAAALIDPTAQFARGPRQYTLAITGDRHDFDFIAGSWLITAWRLKRRGAGCRDWDIHTAHLRAWPLLGGLANVEEMVFPTQGWSGMALRHFDLARRQWSIYWIDSRDGRLQPPLHGGFDGDVGLFYGEDVDAGRPVLAEFRWTRIDRHRARWEQAFSYDRGETWETNWVNLLQREGD
jgi:hypothetical protein